MRKEALEYIVNGCEKVEVFDNLLPGLQHTSKPIHEVSIPMQEVVPINTLNGLVDYIGIEKPVVGAFFHIPTYDRVVLKGPVRDGDKQRTIFIQSIYDDKFRPPGFMPVEEFVIFIQSKFIQDEMTAKILKVVGNIKADTSLNVADDGMSQSVQARTGVVSISEVDLPNPVTLKPMRTFSEVEQPSQKFVLRMKKDRDGFPQVGLIEGDAGAWELEAILNIKEWLKSHTDIPVIG